MTLREGGCDTLSITIAESREEEQEKQEALDLVVGEIKSEIGLT